MHIRRDATDYKLPDSSLSARSESAPAMHLCRHQLFSSRLCPDFIPSSVIAA